MEIDGTVRDKLEPTPDEPIGHIAAEQDAAVPGNRPVRNAYREVPLTGCHNSLLPLYRQPHLAFQKFPIRVRVPLENGRPFNSAAKPAYSVTLERQRRW